jgi:hypothetical protein
MDANTNTNVNTNTSKNANKRPWDLLNKSTFNEMDFNEDFENIKSTDSLKKNPNIDNQIQREKTLTQQKSLTSLYNENKKSLALSFIFFAVLLSGYAATIPSSYYSTLHLYAPEKTDTIGTRLSLFTQKLEYASFPVDYKTPISLISRKLREDSVKDAVIQKIESDPKLKDLLSKSSVSVETNYVPNQEILAIEGYANTPELAVLATNYYWESLISEVRTIEKEQQVKIRMWFDLTNMSIEKQISTTMKELEDITPKTFQKSGILKLQQSLGDVFSNLELQKSTLEKQLFELRGLSTRTDFIGLTDSLDPEVSSQLKIYNQLADQKSLVDSRRLGMERLAIIDTISKRIQEVQYELNSISSGQKTAQGQMVNINAKDNQIKVASEQEMDLRSQLMTLRNQKSDLIKFKSQIEMESSIRSAQFKVIRLATPNPSSIRPLPAVKYGFALMIALILSISTVLGYRFFLNPNKK